MGFRITTWNVNGIRNPFSYEPWRGTRTFEAMFDILEADIVVFQETKIQRKDLRDDMILIPGWDCYFSLPKTKKGYSGVVIYTRNATCAPIRAEEGLTGVLCPPNSSVSFRDLPDDQQIGGYPTMEQLRELELDAATLDSEGRCVILEFPAFVLLGLYSPANRDESRDAFRHCFLDILDARIRNLIAMGKRVFVTGDINISRGEIDAAHASEAIRKGTLTEEEFVSAPARRFFNQLLAGGNVVGPRDEGREQPVLHDICRSFHPDRRGMYTCWEQRINARPGNYGSRIDYVLCSHDMEEWFCESNIQEGLMGSDHCPVYAVFKDLIPLGDKTVNILDVMNPPGVFRDGQRQQEYTTKFLLPLSGRLIPEFDKRRSIKDMFSRKPTGASQKPTPSLTKSVSTSEKETPSATAKDTPSDTPSTPLPNSDRSTGGQGVVRKRSEKENSTPTVPVKRSKSVMGAPPVASAAGQKTLKGFFKPKSTPQNSPTKATPVSEPSTTPDTGTALASDAVPTSETHDHDSVIDPIAAKEDWTKLFSKKPTPRCDGHQEPCISLTTKKPGVNCGRAFWICPRPLGPSGEKEKGTQWRCPTFIWASDYNP